MKSGKHIEPTNMEAVLGGESSYKPSNAESKTLPAQAEGQALIKERLDKEIDFRNQLMEYLPLGLLVISSDSQQIEYVNPKGKDIFGWHVDLPCTLDGFFTQVFPNPDFRRAMQEKYRALCSQNTPACFRDVAISVASGEQKAISITTIPIREQCKMVAAIMDTTEHKRTEDMLLHLAAYDPLTDLPNRTLFHDRLSHALEHARRNNTLAAVMVLDLDNFKTVNDAYGLDYGDDLLYQVARRLKGVLRESDTVSRLGGDEFGILIEDFTRLSDLEPILRKILNVFLDPFSINAASIYITASIGVSLYPEHGSTMQTLIKNADTAVHAAKELGKNNYSFFSQGMGDKALDMLVMTTELRHALSKQEFELYYQPQYDLTSGKIIGIEALLRWNHPAHGLVYPTRFIPLAEDSGVIVSIGEWVLRTACRQSVAWQKGGLPPLRMSVNLSERQMKHPHFIETIRQTLDETGMAPDYLTLEFTENIIFRDTEHTFRVLEQLRSLGIHLALDDFGTGYTSLSYLARFPFDTIKIDLSFAKKITTYPGDAAIVAGVIAIAKSLDMATIVEGVETSEQANFFIEKGCSQIQGWFFSPAVPATDMEAILKGKKRSLLGAAERHPSQDSCPFERF